MNDDDDNLECAYASNLSGLPIKPLLLSSTNNSNALPTGLSSRELMGKRYPKTAAKVMVIDLGMHVVKSGVKR